MRRMTNRHAMLTLMLTGLVMCAGRLPAARAQDPWVTAPQSPAQVGEMIEFSFGVGSQFPVSDRPIPAALIDQWVVVGPNSRETVTTLTAFENYVFANPRFPEPGVYTIAIAMKPEYVQLDPLRFDDYLKIQKAAEAYQQLKQRGLEDQPGRELRMNYAKTFAMVGGGGGTAWKEPVGHRLELVPLTNPMEVDLGESIRFQILLDGKPAEGIRVCTGHVGRREYNYFTQIHSNPAGQVEVIPNRPGQWYVRAHLTRPVTEETIEAWRTSGGAINADPIMPPSIAARPEENGKPDEDTADKLHPDWESFFATATFNVR